MNGQGENSRANLIEVKRQNPVLKFVRENLLLVCILISIVVGFGIGIGLRQVKWSSPDDKLWFTLPGMLFIRSLELLILPVVFVGVVSATASLSAKSNLRMTLISVGLCFLSHILATLTALVGSIVYIAASETVDPLTTTENGDPTKQKTVYDIIVDILRNLIPKNIIKAATHQEITKYYYEANKSAIAGSAVFTRKVEYIDGSNILGVLSFSVLIGLSASMLHDRVQIFRDFFKALNDIIILCLRWLITIAPIGIASLIIDACFEVEDFGDSFKKIGLFTGICIAALLFYGVIVLCLLIFITIRKNPFPYYAYFLEPALLAFASGSGAVCIHKGIDVCETKIKMDTRVSRFGIPFFTALQADGSAVFIVMSCTFLTYYEGGTLAVGDFVVIIIMTSILCLCLPSVPSSSIVTILVVLSAVNKSPNIAILYTVEWLLDRIRTGINFYSHCFCTVIAYELCKNKLSSFEIENEPSSSEYEGQLPLVERGKSNPDFRKNSDRKNSTEIDTINV